MENTSDNDRVFGADKLELIYIGNDFNNLEKTLSSLALVIEGFLRHDMSIESESFSLNITLCNDEKIKELNSEFRDKNKITDVLSFPLEEDIRSGEFDYFLPHIELGDIYICESVCRKQAKEFKLEFFEEFIHLAIHGFLHLCGYDHEISEQEEKLMESLEAKLISKISDQK